MSRYDDLADAAGVSICWDADCPHQPATNVIHMDRKRFTHAGAYALLSLAYGTYDPRLIFPRISERWERLYHRAMWMQDVCERAGYRMPRTTLAPDRARLREALADYRRRIPPAGRTETFSKAERWAAR